jgi:hypothetical protein
MCPIKPLAAALSDLSSAPDAGPPQPLPSSASSRRRKLWELDPHDHCPVIGTCFELDEIRRLVRKANLDASGLSEFELHRTVVSYCKERNRLSEILQRSLERRFALVVQRFSRASSAAGVLAAWQDSVRHGEVAGALWAALTHPGCDGDTAHLIYGEVHMLSHQSGAGQRADLERLAELERLNSELRRELDALSEKSAERLADKSAEVESLKLRLALTEAETCAKEALIARLMACERSESMRAEEEDLRARAEAHARRAKAAEATVAELGLSIAALAEELAETRADLAAAEEAIAQSLAPEGCTEECEAVRLDGRCVLCVGGRPGLVELYRGLVERLGGRFQHHDGGIENNPRTLDAPLAGADAVVCQAGCISHITYGKLKEHCKRTGKPCVYLKRPSVSGFARGIRSIAQGGWDASASCG